MTHRLYRSSRFIVWAFAFILLALLAVQPAIVSHAAGIDNTVWWAENLHDSRDPLYRTPDGSAPLNTDVTLRLRTEANDLTSAQIRAYNARTTTQFNVNMTKVATDGAHDWWAATINTGPTANIIYYWFRLTDGNDTDYYQDDDRLWGGVGQMYNGAPSGSDPDFPNDENPDRSWALTVYDPAFATPDWVKNAVFYQVFVDRFRNGTTGNDNAFGDPFYDDGTGTIVRSSLDATPGNWNDPVCDPRELTSDACEGSYSRNFYGGNLQGLIDKLPYLQDLGVTALYLNPIFESPSNHKYDTSDFSVIDDNFGTLADFSALTGAADALGISIVLDGVFNHASSDGQYFDRYSRYPLVVGACEDDASDYAPLFEFTPDVVTPTCADDRDYPSWFGFDSLPVLNSAGTMARDMVWGTGITHPIGGLKPAVASYWIGQGAAGWRLDVAADVDSGMFETGNDYWENFRSTVKLADPDAYIVGEEWGIAVAGTSGGEEGSVIFPGGNAGEWDATMNYQQAGSLISFWRDTTLAAENDFNVGSSAGLLEPYSPSMFVARYSNLMERYSPEAFAAMMNLLGSHDTQRALWLLDHGQPASPADGTLHPATAAYDWSDALNRLHGVALMQFTLPGAPQIYYGDEVGLVGQSRYTGGTWQDDPYNRQPFPWLDEAGTPFFTHLQTQLAQDANFDFYELLAETRAAHPALRTGDIDFVLVDDGNAQLGYTRQTADGSDTVIVFVNRDNTTNDFTNVWLLNKVPTNSTFDNVLTPTVEVYTVSGDGEITVDDVPANTGVLLVQTSAVVLLPDAPTGLTATENGLDVDLAWSSTGSSHYQVFRSLLSGGGYVYIGTTTTTNFTDTTANPGTVYYYVVYSYDQANGLFSDASNEDSAQTAYDLASAYRNVQWPPSLTHVISTEDFTDTVYGQLYIGGVTDVETSGPVPGIVAQVGFGPTASDPTIDDSAWTWFDMAPSSSGPPDNYNYSSNNDQYQGTILPDEVGSFLYTVRYSADNGATWHYATAFNGGIQATCPDQEDNPANNFAMCQLTVNASGDAEAPTAPVLVKDFDTATEIGISWSGAIDNDAIGKYRIYRAVESDPMQLIDEVDDAVSSYVDNDTVGGTTYHYTVTAVDESFNESPPSNIVDAIAENSLVDVTFTVTVPAFTPSSSVIQVIGDAPELTTWGSGVDMTATANPNEHEVTIQFEEGATFEYKFRRDGSWDKVEKQANGYDEFSRFHTLGYAEDGPVSLTPTVANWRDVLVTATSPADDSTGVLVTTDIAVDFNKTVNGSSEFVVLDENSDEVPGTFLIVSASVTFNPTDDLCYDDTYTVSVEDTSAAGDGFQYEDHSFDFTTETTATTVDVTFNVTIPGFTPSADTIYLSGDDPALGDNVIASGVAPEVGATDVWTGTVALTLCDEVTVVAHRGSAATVETDAATGFVDQTHDLDVEDEGGGAMTVSYTVGNWRDVLVTATTPLDNATGVAIASNINVSFNKDVDSASDFEVLDSASNEVAGNFMVDNSTVPTVKFDPTVDLCQAHDYTVNVTGVTSDPAGDTQLAPYSFDFTTAGALIDVTFNVTIPGFTPDGDTIYLTGDDPALGGNVIASGVALTQVGVTDVWTGTVELSDCDEVTLFAHRGSAGTVETDAATGFTPETHDILVTDEGGGAMTVSYTVGNWEDPLVTTVSPADGATLVSIDTTVSATFSKNVNSTPSVVVLDFSNDPVAGSSVYTAATRTVEFTPDEPLEFDATYTVTVSGAVGVDGAAQVENSVTTFTTSPKTVTVTWNVTLPSFTPSGPIYISGNQPSLGSDVLNAVAMTNNGPNQWTFSASFLEDASITYTYSRGTSNTRATEADGETLYVRTFTVDGNGGTTQTVNDLVGNWRDPIVLSASPVDNATRQPANTPISVTFSKPINPSFNPSLMFSIVNSDSQPEAGTFSYDAPSKTLTFTPSTEYRFADTITVTISGFNGAASGVQEGAYAFSFKTMFYELLDNGDFEADPDNKVLLPWTIKNKTQDKLKCNNDLRAVPVISGRCAFKFKGSLDEKTKLKQNVDFSTAPFVVGDELILSAYADNSLTVQLKLILKIDYVDATDEKLKLNLTTTNGYVLFTLPTTTVNSLNIASIKVQFVHKSPADVSYVDDVSLKLRQGNARRIGIEAVLPPPPPGISGEWRGN